MKFLILSFIIVLFLAATAQAQKLTAKFSVFSTVDPTSPTLQFGLEYGFLKNWAAELNFGLRTRTNPLPYDDNENVRYYKIKPEVKFYIPRDKPNQWYIGLGYQYIPLSNDNINGRFSDHGTTYSYQRAHIVHNVSVVAIKAGHVKYVSKKFSFDFFGGAGIRMINNKHSNFIGLKQEHLRNNGPSFGKFYEGNGIQPHFEAGVKVGFLLLPK